MRNDGKAVVFIGQSYPSGVYFNLARLGIAMYECCPNDIDFYYMASKEEANEGAWELIKQDIPQNAILEGDSLACLISKAECLFEKYNKVLFHTGGGFKLSCLCRSSGKLVIALRLQR